MIDYVKTWLTLARAQRTIHPPKCETRYHSFPGSNVYHVAHSRLQAAAAADLMRNITATQDSLARFQEVAFPAFPLIAPPAPQAYSAATPNAWPAAGPSSAPTGPVRAPSASSQFSDRPPHSHSSSSELSTAEYYPPHAAGANIGPGTGGGPLSGSLPAAHAHTSATRLSIANLVERPRPAGDPRDLYTYPTPPVAGPSSDRGEPTARLPTHRAGFGFADAYNEPLSVPPLAPPLHGQVRRQDSHGESVDSDPDSDEFVDDPEDDDDEGTIEDSHGIPRRAGEPSGRRRHEME